MLDLYKYKYDLEVDKGFRDAELKRLCDIRRENPYDNNTQNACNLIISYIYDLNWANIRQSNQR